MLVGFAIALVVALAVLGGMIAFGTGKAPKPMASLFSSRRRRSYTKERT